MVSNSENNKVQSSLKGSGGGELYLTVTELARLLNDVFEVQLPQLMFRGEISQLTVAQSGHLYFTIKDAGAQMSCVMWGGVARTLQFKPQQGVTVRCHARPNIYAQSGRFQMVVHRMTPDGEGELQRKFLELRERLDKEGLFSPDRKRVLPFLPRAIGLVTSKTGAVIHDMMVKVRERFPSMVVYLADTRVQGEGAAVEIAAAIQRLDASRLVDVIIVARGGGSLEDLWAFNEEVVVRAVFAASVPVVSGVGHEVDVTLCDLAADVRAPTPTAAAEWVVPRRTDLLAKVDEWERRLRDTDRWFQPRVQRLDELSMRLDSKLGGVLQESKLRLQTAEARLATIKPDRVLLLLSSRIDLLAARIGKAGTAALQQARVTLDRYQNSLGQVLSLPMIANHALVVDALAARLRAGIERGVVDSAARLENLDGRFTAMNPRRVLERGYAIVKNRDEIIRGVGQLQRGSDVNVVLHDGSFIGSVKEVSNGEISKELDPKAGPKK